MTIEGKRYVDEDVRITDLFADEEVLTGYVFRNCRILGPAVILIENRGIVDGNEFDVDGDALGMLWLKPDSPTVYGAVSFQRTGFYDCTFKRIGIAGSLEVLQGLFASGNAPAT